MSETKTVEVCGQCQGEGVVQRSELVNYHTRDYDYWTETCSTCDGTGRRLKTVTTTYEPYKPEAPRPRGRDLSPS